MRKRPSSQYRPPPGDSRGNRFDGGRIRRHAPGLRAYIGFGGQ